MEELDDFKQDLSLNVIDLMKRNGVGKLDLIWIAERQVFSAFNTEPKMSDDHRKDFSFNVQEAIRGEIENGYPAMADKNLRLVVDATTNTCTMEIA